MSEIGRVLLVVGLLIAVLGAVLWTLGKMGFRGLPGDIRYESDGVRIYIPIVSMLLLSAVATLLLWLWRWLSGR